MVRRRLDAEMARRRLVSSRSEAREAIEAGLVRVGGVPAAKPATLVADADPIVLDAPPRAFVSRGGEKLAAALRAFGVDARDRRCLDAGASTGGFTDCLLQVGARHVVAVDVGYGQLHWRLRTDPRVTVMERTNIRSLSRDDLPFEAELIVADLSFISLRTVIPVLAELAAPGAMFVVLVKPQFEAGRGSVGKKGVVADPEVWHSAIEGVAAAFTDLGLEPGAVVVSPLLGPAGNVEFLLSAGGEPPSGSVDIPAAVQAGLSLRAAS